MSNTGNCNGNQQSSNARRTQRTLENDNNTQPTDAFPSRHVETISKDDGQMPFCDFTTMLSIEMQKCIFSFAVDESLVVLSRVNKILYETINQFMEENLEANYDPKNRYMPFKNRFADFSSRNMAIAITYHYYSLRNTDKDSCSRYLMAFHRYCYSYVQSWIESGFTIAKSDVGYDLTINGVVVQLNEWDNVSEFLLQLFLPRYMLSHLFPYFGSKQDTPKNELESDPVFNEKHQLLLNMTSFCKSRLVAQCVLLDITILVDSWSVGGFLFKKLEDGYYGFIVNGTPIKFDETSDLSCRSLLEFFARYFLSCKIVAHSEIPEAYENILDAIDFYVRHKLKPEFPEIIFSLISHFYEKCHCDADQPFWTRILVEFVKRGLIDTSAALPLKEYALGKLEDSATQLQIQLNLLDLFHALMDKELVIVNADDVTPLMAYVFKKCRDERCPWMIQLRIIDMFNKLLIKNLLKLNADDKKFFKGYFIERLISVSTHLQVQDFATCVLNNFLSRDLIDLNMYEVCSLKVYIIEKLRNLSLPLYARDRVAALLNTFFFKDLVRLDADEAVFLTNYVVATLRDSSLHQIHPNVINILVCLLLMGLLNINAEEITFLNDYVIMHIKDASSPLVLPIHVTTLLDALLKKNLIESRIDNKAFWKDLVMEIFKNPSSSWKTQLDAINRFNNLFIKNLLEINEDDGSFLKTYLIGKFQDSSPSLQMPIFASCTLNNLLISNLVNVDVEDAEFIKNYTIRNLGLSSSFSQIQYNLIGLFNSFFRIGLLKMNVEEKDLLNDYALQIQRDPSFGEAVQKRITIFLENLSDPKNQG